MLHHPLDRAALAAGIGALEHHEQTGTDLPAELSAECQTELEQPLLSCEKSLFVLGF